MPSLRTSRATAASCGSASLAPIADPASTCRSASAWSASTRRPTPSTRPSTGCGRSGALAIRLSQCIACPAERRGQLPPLMSCAHLVDAEAVELGRFPLRLRPRTRLRIPQRAVQPSAATGPPFAREGQGRPPARRQGSPRPCPAAPPRDWPGVGQQVGFAILGCGLDHPIVVTPSGFQCFGEGSDRAV